MHVRESTMKPGRARRSGDGRHDHLDKFAPGSAHWAGLCTPYMEGVMEFRKAWKAFVGVVVGALFLVATVAFAAPPDKVDLSKYKIGRAHV